MFPTGEGGADHDSTKEVAPAVLGSVRGVQADGPEAAPQRRRGRRQQQRPLRHGRALQGGGRAALLRDRRDVLQQVRRGWGSLMDHSSARARVQTAQNAMEKGPFALSTFGVIFQTRWL